MADNPLTERLFQHCLAYQRAAALLALDTPPGEEREARVAEALAQAHATLTPATREALRSLYSAAPASEQASLKRLWAWGATMYVQHTLLPMQREIAERQRTAVCLVDEEPIPLRAAFNAMATETRRDRRAAIEAAVCGQLRDLHPLFEEQFRALGTVVETLGYNTPETFWAALLPVEPATLQDVATQMLAQTQEIYLDLLAWAARRRLRLAPGQLRRHDILALFTFPEYQAYYQPGTVVPALQAWLGDLGLSPDVDGRLTWRERSPHFGPPVALALQIPDEIVLSYAPVQGVKGAEAWASASGRALLWAHTSPDLPAISRALGDPALVESNASLLAELLADPQWLAHYLRVHVDTSYTVWRCLDRLYRLRRALGRFLYTRYLYTNNSLAGASEAYRDLMMDACHVDYPQEYYLLDWDWEYSTLTTLRSWSLAATVLEMLQTQFAGDWFRNPDMSAWLQEYWASVLGERLEEVRDGLLGTTWDAEIGARALLPHG
jgi:hypothetical protein